MLFTPDDLDHVYAWLCDLRLAYSHNNDIWDLRRQWKTMKADLLERLNEGTFEFSPLTRYVHPDHTVTVWSSMDMLVLKLITLKLYGGIKPYLSSSCVHVKGHGGLKKAVKDTYQATQEHHYVFRSDIKSYYESIRFYHLMEIIREYITDPILLTLLAKALYRTETMGGLYESYDEKGLPMGSPLSPLLGAIALLPLDQAMDQMPHVYYKRYMDDWVVLTKSKTALRQVIKKTHDILNRLQLKLHPTKTYIGKISHGFQFLSYYVDHEKLLPSKESVRRAQEKCAVLYEHALNGRKIKRYKIDRDTSEYQTDEPPPTNADIKVLLNHLTSKVHSSKPCSQKVMKARQVIQRYIKRWATWLKCGLQDETTLLTCVTTYIPALAYIWNTPAASLRDFMSPSSY